MLQNAQISNNNSNNNNKCNDNDNNSEIDGDVDGDGNIFQTVQLCSTTKMSPVATNVESTTTKTNQPTREALSTTTKRRNVDETVVDSSTPTTTTIERRKKKPYKELTLEEKVQLIRLAEDNAGMSQASIAERYSIAKSNVCRILQRKHEYLRAYECAGFAGSRKRKLRGDPQHHHQHLVQQHQYLNCQRHENLTFPSNFQILKTSNSKNQNVFYDRSNGYTKLVTSDSSSNTERLTTDNRLLAPQYTAAVIQSGNSVIGFYVILRHLFIFYV